MEVVTRPVPFKYLINLLWLFYTNTRHKRTVNGKEDEEGKRQSQQAQNIFKTWWKALPGDGKSPVGPQYCELGTIAAILDFLFPDLDARRRYSMGAKALAKHYSDSNSGENCSNARKWGGRGEEEDMEGYDSLSYQKHCLGLALFEDYQNQHNPKRRKLDRQDISNIRLSIVEMDRAIDALAALTSWSLPAEDGGPQRVAGIATRYDALSRIFGGASGFEWAVLVQVILRDIGPLFCAAGSKSDDQLIKDHGARSVRRLKLEDALKIVHPDMTDIQRLRPELRLAAQEIDGKLGQRVVARFKLMQQVGVSERERFASLHFHQRNQTEVASALSDSKDAERKFCEVW